MAVPGVALSNFGDSAMTRDKAPEWAKAEVQRIYERYEMSMSGAGFRELVATVHQAYERGQVDMRERAAVVSVTAGPQFYYNQHSQTRGTSELEDFISRAIRSLPIDSAGKDA